MRLWRLAAVAATLLAATGGCGVRTGSALDLGHSPLRECAPAPDDGAIMFGSVLLRNEADHPVTITDVSLVDPHEMSLAGAVLVATGRGESLVGVGYLADADDYRLPSGWDDRVDAPGATVEPGEEWNLVVMVDSHSDNTAWALATLINYDDPRGKQYQQETLNTIIVTQQSCKEALRDAPGLDP